VKICAQNFTGSLTQRVFTALASSLSFFATPDFGMTQACIITDYRDWTQEAFFHHKL